MLKKLKNGKKIMMKKFDFVLLVAIVTLVIVFAVFGIESQSKAERFTKNNVPILIFSRPAIK